MPSRNRDTLKYFFSDGAMPSSDMFDDLIDSMLNMDDEGFRKSEENGFEISSLRDSESLISFYKQSDPDDPLWSVRFHGSENNLVIGKAPGLSDKQLSDKDIEKAKYLLTLCKHENNMLVGIGLPEPKDTLHVAGNIRSDGRRGAVNGAGSLPADGGWHNIAGPFVGCQAVEVVARAKNDLKKRYGIMHAIATHALSPEKRDIFSLLRLRSRIRYTQAFYDSFLHRLKLRWRAGSKRGQYYLQIRTNCDYGEGGVIDYHVTNLWSDQDPFLQNENEDDK